MEMGSSRFGEDSALDPHPELSEHHQQQFLFPGPGPLPLGFWPCTGRGAQEGTAAAWLQHRGSGVGPSVDLAWAKAEQRCGNCSGSVRGNDLHHFTLQRL